ncbi:hypothetical protein [Streptomyces sp. WM6386]|uniref:hypothetical protein n=1 Tax=Streptomyces sp. WM6386 TaxID=1415558 RepID=UPI0006192C5B|nr:hypothetical protein [Streptomyces sp. WM6386]KKD05747.1 hypothetical protein TN53_22775 [Streptomyces sp. WM6386]
MTTAQTEGLIGMLIVLAILVLLVAPAVIGIVRDRRIDRQIREAELDREVAVEPRARRQRRSYVTTTVTHHS